MSSEDEPGSSDGGDSSDEPSTSDDELSPSDDEVVRTAAEAAENVIFSRLSNSAVKDFDVTVSFEEGVLDVDVYLNAPDDERKEEQIAEDAVLAARSAVDDLFADAED